MLGDACQQFHCFQMLDEMMGCLNTSANIVGIAHAFSLKIIARYSHFDRGSRSQTHSSFTRIQIITSIEMLDRLHWP